MNPLADCPESIHRIGAVSQASGVPVSTLRIWESRYRAFTPVKTGGGHRYYRDEDVLRAQLMRQLTELGHAISRIAALSVQQLSSLLHGQAGPDGVAAEDDVPLTIAVIGMGLASRLQSAERARHGLAARWSLGAVFESLDSALSADWPDTPQVLVAHINSLHVPAQQDLLRLMRARNIAQGVVIYGFGQSLALETLQQSGLVVRREPISDADLPELIEAVRVPPAAAVAVELRPGALIPPRRYDDATLMRVAAHSDALRCECPRHVADLLRMLCGFEQYSRDCLNTSPEDAEMHSHLRAVSGSARALFESALERLAAYENFPLD